MNKTYWVLLEKQGQTHMWLSPMDSDMDVPVLIDQQRLISALCRQWMYFGGPAGSNGCLGILSLVTVSPVITAFYSCCLLHYVFDQVNLWPAWLGIETTIFRQCSPETVETQCLYPLHHGPQRMIKVGFFGLINPVICSPYLVFHSWVHTEFCNCLYWESFWDEAS